ncbi:predicted protein [Chaetomium globosum CBS 148.51]|uniref:Uncharacterized protein n=1 Tax=Chaetomium globosum (strain ATCC 6205 / CBS 148.51 / DSM 1962 / NBRC 6347 / NRRL 1970) TaxID=306901 RepID=Q2HEN4_CHAGB|nr:uncharacterized protein CHGG_01320 [Chaetomium globosum CBS 148.51]EAQ93085.1 predicted protein [Chaetomium globosum CBS 148.51]
MATLQTHDAPGPAQVQAVIIRCNIDKIRSPPWSATTISADHPVFSQAVPFPPRAHRDPAGRPPRRHASHVGTVVAARKDKKPLLPHHLEGVWMYCDYILDLFGEGGGAPTRLYSRQAFEKWWGDYCEEQKRLRTGDGGEKDPDDCRAVRSPYEISPTLVATLSKLSLDGFSGDFTEPKNVLDKDIRETILKLERASEETR